MKELLLPNYFKKIAIATGIPAIILWCVLSANPEMVDIPQLILTWIFKMMVLLSLLIYILSKEKTDDQRIAQLRMENIGVSFLAGVGYLVIDTFVEILYAGENFEIMSGYQLLMLIFLVYLVRFHIKKNIKMVVRA